MIPTWGAAFGANAIFNSAEFRADLTHSAVPDKAAPGTTATFTRATTKTVENNDGYLVTLLSGEIGFPGARREYNQISNGGSYKSEGAFNSWTKAGVPPTVTDGIAGPDGRLTAARVVFAGSGAGNAIYTVGANGTGRTGIVSAQIRGDAAGTIRLLASNSGAFIDAAVTTEWQRFTIPAFAMTNTDGVAFLRNDVGQLETIYVADAMIKDVTAQTTQTAGEYVSVGVESAPYYHGSMVDGVKCFNTDIAGNALPTSYTYDAVSLNGVAGTYVSTPDSVANSITGDIDIRCLNDYQAVNYTPMAKGETNGDRSWRFYVESSGLVNFDYFVGGLDAGRVTATSTASVVLPFSGWIRSTVDVDDGAGNHIVRFYTSLDGAAWTQLGVDVVVAGVITLFESSSIIAIGEWAGVFFGASKAYQAQIYNGIDGTLAVDFDASRYAGGTTLTGSTGETWTLQGNAVIHPTNNPMLGYQVEGARTNLFKYSNTFSSLGSNGPLTETQNAIGPNGQSNYAWTLTDDSAVVTEDFYNDVTLTAAVYTQQIKVKKTTGAQTAYPVLHCTNYAGTLTARCTIDTTNGIATVWTAATGFTVQPSSARCHSQNANFWIVELTFTGTADAGWFSVFVPAGTTNPVQSTGILDVSAQGSHVVCDAQLELGSSASSYIATTTIAVARNADVLTYSSAGNIDGTKGWCYAEASAQWSAATGVYNILVGIDTANRGPLLAIDNAPTAIYIADGTNAVQATGASTTFNSTSKRASTWGGSTMSVTGSGAAVASGAFDGNMNVGANIAVGILDNGGSAWFGTIRNVRIGQRQLSASELGAITS